MPLDQIHEMNNKQVKGDGGCIGLTEDSHALLRWMISGPEISRLLSEFEESIIEESSLHHEQLPYFQSLFKNHVQAMVATSAKLGNPYCEDSQGLVSLISRDIPDKAVIVTLKSIERKEKKVLISSP